MEVHHHPELPHGEKKRFKEYFLEFLMIFLAVTMGFIAENIREHLSDNSKQYEYINGLVKNLESDTVILKKAIANTKIQVRGIDTLRHVSKDQLTQLNVQDSLLLLTLKYLFSNQNFRNNDITLSQLRNAGGYRVIRKEGALDSIAVYESLNRNLTEQFSECLSIFDKARDRAGLIFDLNAAELKFFLHPGTTPVIISYDKERIQAFYNASWFAEVALQAYNAQLKNHLLYSTHLIAYLKKLYDIN